MSGVHGHGEHPWASAPMGWFYLGLSIGPADATLFVAHFVALSRLRTAGGVAGVLRLASRANIVVYQNGCVNTLIGPPVL